MTASFLSEAGLAVLFLVLFALFIDERPLLSFLRPVVGAKAESVGAGVVTVFFVNRGVMSWAEWRKMRSAPSVAVRAPRAPSGEK